MIGRNKGKTIKMRQKYYRYIAAVFVLLVSGACFAAGDKPPLTITAGSEKRVLSAVELLSRPDARNITIDDGSYAKTMHYRAVPLAALFAGMNVPPDDAVEAVAADGFVAALPGDLVLKHRKGAAEAFLAVEPPAAPWPSLPGKKESAGPFYVVWLDPQASGVRSEQWPYMVTELRFADSPAKRWKELAVDPELPADSPVRAGQALFVTQCMTCHTLNGAGSAHVGPDLNRPASPVEYFRIEALKQYIRDPASLRRWQNMQMPGFDKNTLSDREIGLIVDYLEHMAARKTP
jgi:mono/diheme cytochrome c family protein